MQFKLRTLIYHISDFPSHCLHPGVFVLREINREAPPKVIIIMSFDFVFIF